MVTIEIDPNVKAALDHVRSATQELYKAISDAAAKNDGATTADLEVFAQNAKSLAGIVSSAIINAQNDTVKKALADAAAYLQATQQDSAEALRTTGQALQTSIQKALSDARACVQKVSEAVAAARAEQNKAAA